MKESKYTNTQTPYSGGIYSRFSQEKRENNNFFSYIPGIPHLANGNEKFLLKGFLLFFCFIFSVLSFASLFIPFLSNLFLNLLMIGATPSNIEEITRLLTVGIGLKIFYAILLIILISYLIHENKQDLDKKFNNFELDRKPVLLASSISSSYLICISFFIILLIYGFATFIPMERQKVLEIEMPFVDNPPQKVPPKVPPQDAKHVSTQNAVNSGKHDRRLPLSPNTRSNRQNSSPSMPAQPQARPTRPTTQATPSRSPQQAQPIAKPSPAPPAPSPVPFTPQPKTINSKPSNSPVLPSFKPVKGAGGEDRHLLSSNDSDVAVPAPIKPISGGGGSAVGGNNGGNSGGGASGSRPVLPSRGGAGGGSGSKAGLGNAGPNNNPNGPTTVAAKQVDYGPFMSDLQRRIENAWRPASQDKEDKVVLFFYLRKNGSLVPGSISTVSSTNPEAEAAARQAVISASSGFRALPEGAPDKVKIDFTFTRTGTRVLGVKKY